MYVLVTGANGQLGRTLKSLIDNNNLDYQFFFATREHLDLANFKNTRIFIEKNQFDIIINCAAFTLVDKAETEKKQANVINHLSVRNIAQIAKDNSIKLIHISTDYVFDGQKVDPYNEDDNASPLNIYGKTKLDGENAVLSIMEFNAIIIKLFQKNDKLNIVSDQLGSPTNANDLASSLLSIIRNNNFLKPYQASDIYHYSNDGKCSWYDFAKEIAKISDDNCIIRSIDSKDYPQEARRPKQVILNKRKIVDFFDLNIIDWKESLKKCIKSL